MQAASRSLGFAASSPAARIHCVLTTHLVLLNLFIPSCTTRALLLRSLCDRRWHPTHRPRHRSPCHPPGCKSARHSA